MRQVFADMEDILPAERIAVMGAMQRAFNAVEANAQSRLRQRLRRSAEVVQQRFDFTPQTKANFGKINLKRGHRVVELVLKYYF